MVEVKLFFFSFFLLLWNGGHLILTHFNFSFFATFGLPGQPLDDRRKGDSLGGAKNRKPTTATATEVATTTKQRKTAGGTKN